MPPARQKDSRASARQITRLIESMAHAFRVPAAPRWTTDGRRGRSNEAAATNDCSPAPSIGGLALSRSHRLAGALFALALIATLVSPALADPTPQPEPGRLQPSTRGSRAESELPGPPPAATAGPAPPPAPTPTPPPEPSVPERIVGLAIGAVGSRYAFGGSSPVTGFDCSGLVHWVLEQIGVDVGRTAAAQYGFGQPIATADLEPGDLVFFANTYM